MHLPTTCRAPRCCWRQTPWLVQDSCMHSKELSRRHARILGWPHTKDAEASVCHALQQLVETAMLAAVGSVAYTLAVVLKLQSYLGYLQPMPIVVAAMRWGPSAARKAMTATFFLLLGAHTPLAAASASSMQHAIDCFAQTHSGTHRMHRGKGFVAALSRPLSCDKACKHAIHASKCDSSHNDPCCLPARAVLLGPLQALTYVLNQGLMAACLGACWSRGVPWAASIPATAAVRVGGTLAYIGLSSWTLNENLFSLLMTNVYSLLVRSLEFSQAHIILSSPWLLPLTRDVAHDSRGMHYPCFCQHSSCSGLWLIGRRAWLSCICMWQRRLLLQSHARAASPLDVAMVRTLPAGPDERAAGDVGGAAPDGDPRGHRLAAGGQRSAVCGAHARAVRGAAARDGLQGC